jgi:hypothetical protein
MRANVARIVLLLASCIGLGTATGSVQAAADLRLAVEGGNIVLIRGTTRKTLTTQKRDGEAVLSPDRQWIVYTRAAQPIAAPGDDDAGDCASRKAPDELRRIKADGTGDELLVRGRAGAEPSQALCGFFNKQFSSDGATLYFLSPAWTTSSALHGFALGTRTARYLMPANDFVVLSWCTSGDLKDAIVAQQHRYFRFGGSYDWYWLFDKTGQTEVGPVGEFDSVEAIKSDLDASGQCGS